MMQASKETPIVGAKPSSSTPITPAPPPALQALPRKYVIHKHSQLCKNCSSLHEWSQAYAFNHMQTRTGTGKLVVNLVPISSFSYNLPIEVITAARTTVPACHECAGRGLNLSHLVNPQDTDEWKRIYSVASSPGGSSISSNLQKEPAKAKSKSPTKTIEDLLF